MARRVMVLELYQGGHHPEYLDYLVRAWTKRRPAAELHLVVSDDLAASSPDLVAAAAVAQAALHTVPTPAGFEGGSKTLLRRESVHRRVAARYADELRPDHLLFMWLDHVQLALALDLRFDWPLELSGIYFRPSFHYAKFGQASLGRRQRVRDRATQAILRAAIRNPHLRVLFCLDPYAAEAIAGWAPRPDVVWLPEPRRAPRGSRESPASGVTDGERRRLVLFGTLDERKGIPQLVEALERLPHSDQRRLALVLAGQFRGEDRDALRAGVRELARHSDVEVVVEDRFVPEEEAQALLASADLVLLPYQHHIGSSGVLVRAAAAGVPVLASDFGLIGEHVRRRRLGLAVDATRPDRLGTAIQEWLDHPDAVPFDPAAARAFADENTADAFTDTLLCRLLGQAVTPKPAGYSA